MNPEVTSIGYNAAPNVETGEVVRPLKIVLIPGSFFGPETMEPVAKVLAEEHGQQAEVFYGLPTQDANATEEDHINALAQYLEEQQDAGFDIVAAPYSGGGGHLEAAMRRVLERSESKSQPVKLVVGASPTLEYPIPEQDDSDLPIIPWQPDRNSTLFRQGILRPDPNDDHFVRYDQRMARQVFFNDPDSHEIDARETDAFIEGMVDQYRVDPSPMPAELLADWDYVLGIRDNVRQIGAVTMLMQRYADKPHTMRTLLVEGDHSLPLTQPQKYGRIIMYSCITRGVLRPPGFPSPGALSRQRRAPLGDTFVVVNPQPVLPDPRTQFAA